MIHKKFIYMYICFRGRGFDEKIRCLVKQAHGQMSAFFTEMRQYIAKLSLATDPALGDSEFIFNFLSSSHQTTDLTRKVSKKPDRE